MEPTSPSQSPPPPGNRNGTTSHSRSISTSIPRPVSRLPTSPTRGASSGLSFDYTSIPQPPTFGLSHSNTGSNSSLYNTFSQNSSRAISPPATSESRMSSSTMPPPDKVFTASLKNRNVPNGVIKQPRETLAERAGKANNHNAPAPGVRSMSFSGGSTKIKAPIVSSAGLARTGSLNHKQSTESMRPKSSGFGLARSTSTSKASSVKSISRPPSAQDIVLEMEQNLFNHEIRNTGPLGRKSIDDWDMDSRVRLLEDKLKGSMEMQIQEKFRELEDRTRHTDHENSTLREKYETERMRVIELETSRAQTETQHAMTKMELENARSMITTLTRELDAERSQSRLEKEDFHRRLRDEGEEVRRRAREEIESLNRAQKDALESIERKLRNELEDEKAARVREVEQIRTQAALEKQKLETKMDSKWIEIRQLKEELENVNRDLERERLLNNGLRQSVAENTAASLTFESSQRSLRARIEQYEDEFREKSRIVTELEQKVKDEREASLATREKLRKEETLRRKLHNQVQELKGNIRVFCRVRPPLGDETCHVADIKFPDQEGEGSKLEVLGPSEKSALGNVITRTYPFTFDKVFGPPAQNNDVFEEISQLVQSALDGYNVCIFCYGQTGSGKTYTMSAPDGMIPQAVHQIYDTATSLEEKGWKYTMEGSFVEVYNENINDLLGRPDDLDKKKHEIRHDPKEKQTTVTGLTTVILDNPQKVETILKTAANNRSVAATKANERSSRSHSVFMLKLAGYNSLTGEKSEGTLNLVDLAGSERLSHSQATGDRLKETQSINKSLSCLGDVISALGSGKDGAHIPYRNSKLTYLLQYSLGGNSKTLMFVMVSPLQAHLNESLTSLKFATKVSNTYIGTARKRVTSA